MNFNNKNLARLSLLLTLAIIISLIAYYVPIISAFPFITGSIFVVIGLISNKKSALILIFIAYFFLMFIFLDPISAFTNTLVLCLPCLVMGYIMRNKKNEDIAYLVGTVIMAISIMFLFGLLMKFMNFDFFENLKTSIDISKNQILVYNPTYKFPDNFDSELIVKTSKNLFPSLMIIVSLFITLLSKYLGLFFLKRIFPKDNFDFKPFREFTVPNKLGMFFLIFYILTTVLSYFNIISNTYSNRLVSNILYLMVYMLVIQGLAILSFFTQRLNKPFRFIFYIITFLLFQKLFLILAFISVIDMAIDLRKIYFRSGR